MRRLQPAQRNSGGGLPQAGAGPRLQARLNPTVIPTGSLGSRDNNLLIDTLNHLDLADIQDPQGLNKILHDKLKYMGENFLGTHTTDDLSVVTMLVEIKECCEGHGLEESRIHSLLDRLKQIINSKFIAPSLKKFMHLITLFCVALDTTDNPEAMQNTLKGHMHALEDLLQEGYGLNNNQVKCLFNTIEHDLKKGVNLGLMLKIGSRERVWDERAINECLLSLERLYGSYRDFQNVVTSDDCSMANSIETDLRSAAQQPQQGYAPETSILPLGLMPSQGYALPQPPQGYAPEISILPLGLMPSQGYALPQPQPPQYPVLQRLPQRPQGYALPQPSQGYALPQPSQGYALPPLEQPTQEQRDVISNAINSNLQPSEIKKYLQLHRPDITVDRLLAFNQDYLNAGAPQGYEMSEKTSKVIDLWLAS